MRILFVVGQFPAVSETFVLNQATGLIDRGHEVDIYAIGSTRALKGVVQLDVLRYGLAKRAFYAPAIPRRRLLRALRSAGLVAETAMRRPAALAAWGRQRHAGTPAGAGQLLYHAAPILRRKRYDIIHCQFGSVAQPLATLRKLGAVTGGLVVSFRGQDSSRYVRQHGRDIYREVFEVGDVFLPNCAYFQRRLLALGCDPRRVIVHRSGLDCARFRFAHRHLPLDRPVRILMIGRLVEKKGMEYGIRALARVTGGGCRVELVIVGDGPLAPQLSALARDLGVTPLLRFTGWQDGSQIAEWLATSHLLMAPSVTAADGDEDAPVNVLKEAMATGMPVIGTRHGGIPELVEDGVSGFLVPERDTEALADRLLYLVTNPQVWPAMGEVGRAFVARHYDLNGLNDRLVEIYRDVDSRTDRRPCDD